MLSKKIDVAIAVVERDRLIKDAKKFIILYTDKHTPLYKSIIIRATKRKFSDISEKAIRKLIEGLTSDGWFMEDIRLGDTRRPVIESINFDMRLSIDKLIV